MFGFGFPEIPRPFNTQVCKFFYALSLLFFPFLVLKHIGTFCSVPYTFESGSLVDSIGTVLKEA
jgi:hypothetical protein